MATNLVHRFRSLPRTLVWASFLIRNISTSVSLSAAPTRCSLSLINRLRLLVGAFSASGRDAPARCFATNLKKSHPNYLPRLETVMEGCDFEHWLVVLDPPEGEPTRDEIIDSYIKTLASVKNDDVHIVSVSEEEARMKIYSVSTTCYYAFGALVSEVVSLEIKKCPRVRWVLPDCYVDVKNRDYGGEPFINGRALPYDPKWHEDWIRNNSRVNANRWHGTPRNIDRIMEEYDGQ
ncbi:hypothetical protein FNV43_RR04098 [Rhamnella rubrinervis]|uniref:MORF/ORRM1/DAG-like MORF domain-containing protein n=1 Tax=Rhamnella rubrinervis TaxID=2594499 RepID=A0A8K0HJ53_9ROSA|nr:hypothetical protein FNV43_RR04098 [Rhamnella rubrinervis]